MGFSKKYLFYWALVIAAAVLADWMNLFEKYEIEGASFIYGLLLGFLIMKFMPLVKLSETQSKDNG